MGQLKLIRHHLEGSSSSSQLPI